MSSTRKGLAVGLWLLALLCATVWAELDSALDEQWELWKTTHQKNYTNEVEELGRRALWEKRLKEISHHNLQASLGLHSYTQAVNHLSDLTKDEISKLTAPMILPDNFAVVSQPLIMQIPATATLPASLDWRDIGYVTSVKHQGNCQSGWAFSAAGALEGLLFKNTGKLVDLSAQNLMDCSQQYGSQGCTSGTPDDAFRYVIANQGIQSEATYTYEAQNGVCRYNPTNKAATCSSYNFVQKDELSLQMALNTFGPISVAIDGDDLTNYKSGVYYNPSCGQKTSHPMLLVGYGSEPYPGRDYWILKNSLGTGWGENGYIRLARNANQMCGISLYSVFVQ